MEKYCIYLRKSRKDDEAELRGDGETLERHQTALMELAKRQNLTLTEVYSEVVSGETISARPVMQKLLNEVSNGIWAGVLVMEVERLARGDTSDQGTVAKAFKFSGTKIITPIKTFDPNDEYDEEFFEFALFMSRREYKIITRRMQRGRVASVREGKYTANQPPYGYKRVKLEKEKGWTLEEYHEQAEIVRMVFEWYTEGEKQQDGTYKRLGVSLIVKRLNQLNILSQKGGIWVSASIRDMLINPVYIGKVRWNWRPAKKKMTADGTVAIERPRSKIEECILVEGLHKGIIAPAVFEKTQKLINQNPPRPIGEKNVVKNPLAGIIYCGKCGRSMSRRPYNKTGYPDTLLCSIPECPNVSSHLSLVEKRVIEALEEWLREYKLQWNLDATTKKKKGNAQLDFKRKALSKIDAEIKTLSAQISKTHDLLEQGIYDTDTFLDRTRELGERKKQAEADRAALENDLEIEEMREESRITIIPKVEHLVAVYHELPTPEAKNDMLKEVLERVEYAKEKGGRWHSSPDNFELTLFPRLPSTYVNSYNSI